MGRRLEVQRNAAITVEQGKLKVAYILQAFFTDNLKEIVIIRSLPKLPSSCFSLVRSLVFLRKTYVEHEAT